jgi:hypothetical protein
MRKIKEWEARDLARMVRPQFWGAVVGAVASTVLSKALSDDEGSGQQQAQQISEEEKAYIREQTKGAEQIREITGEEWKRFKEETLPLIRETAARWNIPGGEEQAISEAVGDVRSQYAQAGERLRRGIELSRGPADPIYIAQQAHLAAAESGDVASAIYSAREGYRDRSWQRLLEAVAAQGDPSGAAAAGAASSSNIYGNAAAGLNRTARTALASQQLSDQRASQAGYAWGRIATPIGRALEKWWSSSTPVAPVDAKTGYSNYPGGDYYTGGFGAGDAASLPYFEGYRHGGAIKRYAEGGKIEGAGTGTSDSVPTVKQPGTYILSADTVRAIGTKKLDDLMEKAGVRPGDGETPDGGGVPIRTSNGEYAIPPRATKYYGEEFFNKMQQKYHRPVMDDDETGMANGGAIRKPVIPRSVEEAIMRAVPAKAIGRF